MSVNAVLGSVPTSELGVTLTHEHLNIKFDKFYVPPPNQLKAYFQGGISLKNVGYIKQYPYSCKSNLDFYGKDVDESLVEELKLFKLYGGRTIVENTSHGIQRNIGLYVKLSKQTGINIIAGTGHYVADIQHTDVLSQGVEELYNTIKTDIQNGCIEYPDVKCGFIGEVGSVWPIKDFERRCIQATGQAQEELGCGVSFHPGRDNEAPAEIIRIYAEAGGKIEKAVMSHLDRTLLSDEELLEFASLGSYCQFDLFGTECSYYQLNVKCDMPSDAQRIDKIMCLINDGKSDKITISHDIHTRHRLVDFGGHGYSHILNNVVPKMLIKNIDNNMIDTIMVKNPATWLACKCTV